MDTYKAFTRNWWKNNPSFINGLEPSTGRKYTHYTGLTEEQAREICKDYNYKHNSGRLGKKMEYTKE